MSKSQDVYGEPIIIERPGAIIRVCRPINLTETEHARRMKRIHDAAAALLMAVERDRKARGIQ